MPRLSLSVVLCFTLAFASAAIGCGGGGGTTTALAAKPAYCAQATGVRSALEAFEKVQLDAGVALEMRSRLTALRASVAALRISAGAALRAPLDVVTTALRAAGQTIASMTDPAQVPTALVALPGDIDAVTTSVTELVEAAKRDCG